MPIKVRCYNTIIEKMKMRLKMMKLLPSLVRVKVSVKVKAKANSAVRGLATKVVIFTTSIRLILTPKVVVKSSVTLKRGSARFA